ncbi:MAG TPA: hypothetical protein VJN92_16590 [Candidatus Acidoferrum sp.]|nr:hypothetical protein [Candidatus Acidoferrum sp.]
MNKTTSCGREFSVPPTSVHRVEADGLRVFYRAAGDETAPNSSIQVILRLRRTLWQLPQR